MSAYFDRRLLVGLAVGILIGWLIIGWVLWPVEWEDATPSLLTESFRADYVKMTADLYASTTNEEEARYRMRDWRGGASYACQLANLAVEGSDEQQRLLNLALAVAPGATCEELAVAAPAQERRSFASTAGPFLAGGLLVVAVLVGVFFVISQRGTSEGVKEQVATGGRSALAGTTGGRTIPLAQFPTEYRIGDDAYDDSFSIETPAGDFLGECGLGISETIGVGDPKRVTAFEIWLFDKNDIRTVTKVIMSDHAYHDAALRAKLAPKGEAVLAAPGAVIVLETAALIINARIVEMEYGTGEIHAESFFGRLAVELATWAKEDGLPAGARVLDQHEDELVL